MKRRSFLRAFTEHRFGERPLIKGVRGTAASGNCRFGELPVRGKHVVVCHCATTTGHGFSSKLALQHAQGIKVHDSIIVHDIALCIGLHLMALKVIALNSMLLDCMAWHGMAFVA